jgi:hypothetical protein
MHASHPGRRSLDRGAAPKLEQAGTLVDDELRAHVLGDHGALIADAEIDAEHRPAGKPDRSLWREETRRGPSVTRPVADTDKPCDGSPSGETCTLDRAGVGRTSTSISAICSFCSCRSAK